MPISVKHGAPLIALFVLFLASLACAVPAATIVKGDITCTYNPSINQSYECTCPLDGRKERYGASDLQTIDNDTLYGNVCQAALIVQRDQTMLTLTATNLPPTPTATQVPPTATLTQTLVPLQPYLTGAFTACDNVARYVNFTIAADAPAYEPATFKVLFNGQEASCTPVGNNSTVFSCKYPPVYRPPVTVEVLIGGQSVNKFEFAGGAMCDPTPTPRPATSSGDAPEPAATATTDPSNY